MDLLATGISLLVTGMAFPDKVEVYQIQGQLQELLWDDSTRNRDRSASYKDDPTSYRDNFASFRDQSEKLWVCLA